MVGLTNEMKVGTSACQKRYCRACEVGSIFEQNTTLVPRLLPAKKGTRLQSTTALKNAPTPPFVELVKLILCSWGYTSRDYC